MNDLPGFYRDYIACLNDQAWQELGGFVHEAVVYNGRPVGLPGYRALLEGDFEAIPDLRFTIELLVAEAPLIASRLRFQCTPKGRFLGLPVNGRTVSFAENVIYKVPAGRIEEVWSVIDKAAVEAEIAGA